MGRASTLAPYVSLLPTYGGSTGYYSPMTVNGTSTWMSTALDGSLPTYLESTSTSVTASVQTSAAAPTQDGTALASGTSPPTADEKMTTERNIGIGVGTGVGISAIATLVAWIWRLRRRRHPPKQRRSNTQSGLLWHLGGVDLIAPAITVLALTAAFLFALGHHLFFRSLAGHPVASHEWTAFGMRLSDQQVNIAAGTAFAFLVKACLVLAVSTAYVQAFWSTAKSERNKSRMTVAQLDAAFSVLGNLLAFAKLRLWMQNPLLTGLAITAWLVPLVAIVTPATLSVQSSPLVPIPSQEGNVPGLDFRSLSFSATVAATELKSGGILYAYNGPSLAVQAAVGAAAMQGSILPISAPSSNATWNLAFTGPSLRCNAPSDRIRAGIEQNIANATFNSVDCYTPPVYVSWFQPDGFLPFENNLSAAGNDATVYFALMPSLLKPSTLAPWNPAACESVSLLPNVGNWTSPLVPSGTDDSTIFQCALVESQYDVGFRYVNGIQSVDVDVTPAGQPFQIVSGFSSRDDVDDQSLRMLSYQSVLHAFNTWVLGTIKSGLSQETPLIVNSSIMSTTLLRAREMSYLAPEQADATMKSVYHSDLQSLLSNTNSSAYAGLMPSSTSSSEESLAAMVEQLFQNITVSLMSSSHLQPNRSSLSAPPAVNVSSVTYRNIYSYSPMKLWFAYGLGLAFAAIAVAIGLVCVFLVNRASYSNNFSTISRTSRNAELSAEVLEQDSGGANPLPDYIGEATVRFRSAPVKTERAVHGSGGPEKGQCNVVSALLGEERAEGPRPK
ncbi:hypothetical protein LTR85_007867 [Meristemomyces frigidus]|nr:hypothetical protein LTR85_007867 [Meristemomyces frigidus]